MLQKIKKTKRYPVKFIFTRSNKDEDDFNKYIDLREIGLHIRNGLMIIGEAKELKTKMRNDITNLKEYRAKSDETKNKK